MNTTVTVTYDHKVKAYKIGDGSWMQSWDYVNNVKISEYGFVISGDQLRLESDNDMVEVTVNYVTPSTITVYGDYALMVVSGGTFNSDVFVFQVTYLGEEIDFDCQNIFGDAVNVFDFSTDGVIYGTNSGNQSQAPASIDAECCVGLGYTFDPDRAQCRWSEPCEIDDFIKVFINPEGNDGVIFEMGDDENCSLKIAFDWLLEYDCNSLLNCVGDGSILEVFSAVTLSMSLERVIASTNKSNIPNKQVLQLPYEPEQVLGASLFDGANILDYFANTNSGIILIGENCEVVEDKLELELTTLFSGFTGQNLQSGWMHYETTIVDPTVINLIRNEKIKLALEITNATCDMSILVDNIELNKQCEVKDIEETFVPNCPSFEIERVIDNKKSWVAKSVLDEREFELKKRETDYSINHHKLGINSKEVDVNVSPARAIETDVMTAIMNIPCLLSPYTTNNLILDLQDNILLINGQGYFPNEEDDFTNNTFGFFRDGELTVYSKFPIISGRVTNPAGEWDVDAITNPHEIVFAYDYDVAEVWYVEIVTQNGDGDLNGLITSELSEVFTLEEFTEIITSELIDAKDRQTLRDYPILRMLYERYLDSANACGTATNAFSYSDMDNFIALIGNYWVELVEQVIPSTTIWGSTYKYSNTFFDNNKFRYRRGSLFVCEPSDIIPQIGANADIEVVKTITTIDDDGKELTTVETCSGVYTHQVDDGSEFLGSVTVIGDNSKTSKNKGDIIILNELLVKSNDQNT